MTIRLPVLFACVATAAVAAQNPDATRPLFSASSAELVVLPVAVLHGDGHFVAGLTKDRFTVFDNGRREPIALFSDVDTPVTLGLLIDDSSSMAAKLGEVAAATLALARSSNPDDQVFALAFNDRVVPLLGGRALPAHEVDALNDALRRLVPDGRTALYDAILAGLDRASGSTATARRVLVVISDGGDNASAATLEQVTRRARSADATIYTIGLFDENDPDTNPGVLKKLAAETGGERFLPVSPGPLLHDIDHIAREIRESYTLGIVPPDRDGRYHRIRVAVAVPDARNLSVRTRPGYVADAPATDPRP